MKINIKYIFIIIFLYGKHFLPLEQDMVEDLDNPRVPYIVIFIYRVHSLLMVYHYHIMGIKVVIIIDIS
jgi:hypothetical protein